MGRRNVKEAILIVSPKSSTLTSAEGCIDYADDTQKAVDSKVSKQGRQKEWAASRMPTLVFYSYALSFKNTLPLELKTLGAIRKSLLYTGQWSGIKRRRPKQNNDNKKNNTSCAVDGQECKDMCCWVHIMLSSYIITILKMFVAKALGMLCFTVPECVPGRDGITYFLFLCQRNRRYTIRIWRHLLQIVLPSG